MGALGDLSGRLRGHGGSPERVQSHFKIIAFLGIEVIWELSEGSWAALWGPRRVLFGVGVAQQADLRGYDRKGSTPVDLSGVEVNGP